MSGEGYPGRKVDPRNLKPPSAPCNCDQRAKAGGYHLIGCPMFSPLEPVSGFKRGGLVNGLSTVAWDEREIVPPLKQSKPEAYSMVPWSSMDAVARMYHAGSKKYSDYGWREGYAWSEAFSALVRHAAKFQEGEDNDPETGEPHMAAVAVHALNLIFFMTHHRDKDDRPNTQRKEA